MMNSTVVAVCALPFNQLCTRFFSPRTAGRLSPHTVHASWGITSRFNALVLRSSLLPLPVSVANKVTKQAPVACSVCWLTLQVAVGCHALMPLAWPGLDAHTAAGSLQCSAAHSQLLRCICQAESILCLCVPQSFHEICRPVQTLLALEMTLLVRFSQAGLCDM